MAETKPGSYVAKDGSYERKARYIETRITREGEDGFAVEPGRYRLVVSRACPWAHRAILTRLRRRGRTSRATNYKNRH